MYIIMFVFQRPFKFIQPREDYKRLISNMASLARHRIICVVILLLLQAISIEACPKRCKCSVDDSNLKHPEIIVDCTNAGLDSIPLKVPDTVTKLILKNNRISAIRKSQVKRFTQLRELDLSKNLLVNLHPSVLKHLPTLTNLDVRGNALECDCRIFGLFEASKEIQHFRGNCHGPPLLSSRDIATLEQEEFCRGCGIVKYVDKKTQDGEYFITVKSPCTAKIQVYCAGMNTTKPREYITLPAGAQNNFASFFHYELPEAHKDQCDYYPGGLYLKNSGVTTFTRVRLNLDSMAIVNNDFRFAKTTGGNTPIPYGTAGDCYSAAEEDCLKGNFEIDLTGTDLKITDDVSWETYGHPEGALSRGNVESFDMQSVIGRCGGYCGMCKPKRKIFVTPKTCKRGIVSRAVAPTCGAPMGMEHSFINNSRISASSYLGPRFKPEFGRLNNIPSDTSEGVWCAAGQDTEQYLQIDLASIKTIAAIATQGQSNAQNWVTEYKIQYSKDGITWTEYMEYVSEKRFTGNADKHSVKRHELKPRFVARYVRINPQKWNDQNSPQRFICLRADLYGCERDFLSTMIKSTHDGQCAQPVSGYCDFDNTEGEKVGMGASCLDSEVMFRLLDDGSLLHSCTGKCVTLENGALILRESACHKSVKFTKQLESEGNSFKLVEISSQLCVARDSQNNNLLTLDSCDTNPLVVFTFSQEGLLPIAPSFSKDTEVYLEKGKPGWIHSKVVGDPLPQVIWTKEAPYPFGKPLDGTLFKAQDNGSLYMSEVKSEYKGTYQANAANSRGSFATSFKVLVGEMPKFKLSPEDTTVVASKSAMFSCTVHPTSLTPKISWKQMIANQETSTPVSELGTRFTEYSNGSLEIKKVRKSDQAFYVCIATNVIGTVQTSAFLRILVSPVFDLTPTDLEDVPTGSAQYIHCNASGDPEPEIKWTRAGSDSLGYGTQVFPNGTLYFKEIVKSHEGVYYCEAENSVGKEKTSFELNVYAACEIKNFVGGKTTPSGSFFHTGVSVKFECNPGFLLAGSSPVTCNYNSNTAEWEKALPTCSDINECSLKNRSKDCDINADCLNTVGSFKCVCRSGYAGDGFKCSTACKKPSGPSNGQWVPDRENYYVGEEVSIRCNLGFSSNAIGNMTCNGPDRWLNKQGMYCSDINECSIQPCHTQATCVNSPGSFKCICNNGLEGDGIKTCKVPKDRSVEGQFGTKKFTYSAMMDVIDDLMNLGYVKNGIILQTLANLTTPSSILGGDALRPGDLIKSALVLEKIKDRMDMDNQYPKQEEIKYVVEISSNLLDEDNIEDWEALKNYEDASRVAAILEKFMFDYLQGLEIKIPMKQKREMTMESKNILLALTITEPDLITDKGLEFPSTQQSDLNDGSASISLPASIFKSGGRGYHKIKIVSTLYRDLGIITPVKDYLVKSRVISTAVKPEPILTDGKMTAPVNITLEVTDDWYEENENLTCVFLNRSSAFWSPIGCRLVKDSGRYKICQCDHITDFAIAKYSPEIPDAGARTGKVKFDLVVYVGIGILLLAALIAIIKHAVVLCKKGPERAEIHINFCLSIILSMALFLGTVNLVEIYEVCVGITALLHYFITCTFMWVMIEIVQLYQVLFTGCSKNYRRRKWFYMFGWGIPAIIIGVSLGLNRLQGYSTEDWCWFQYEFFEMSFFFFAGGPGGLLVLDILLIWIGLIISCCSRAYSDYRRVSICMIYILLLLPIIGGVWVSADLFVNSPDRVIFNELTIRYIFAGGCALLGLLILLYHCILDKPLHSETFPIHKREKSSKRNYYSTTDTVTYTDGQSYKVTRPSVKSSTGSASEEPMRPTRSSSQIREEDETELHYPPSPTMPKPMSSFATRRTASPEDGKESPILLLRSGPRSDEMDDVPIGKPTTADRQPDGAEAPKIRGSRNGVNQHSLDKKKNKYHSPDRHENKPIFGFEQPQQAANNIPSVSTPDDHDVPMRKRGPKRSDVNKLDGIDNPSQRRKRAHRLSYVSGAADVEFTPQKVDKPYASL